MDVLVIVARWLEAIALVAGLMAVALGFLAVALWTPARRDSWNRNHARRVRR